MRDPRGLGPHLLPTLAQSIVHVCVHYGAGEQIQTFLDLIDVANSLNDPQRQGALSTSMSAYTLYII